MSFKQIYTQVFNQLKAKYPSYHDEMISHRAILIIQFIVLNTGITFE